MTLPQETIDKIKKESVQADVKNQNKSWEYRAGYRSGNEDGATEWAEKAEKHLIAALEAIIGKTMPVPNKADMIDIAKTALAKYKEVSK